MIVQSFNDRFSIDRLHGTLKEAFQAAEKDKSIMRIRMIDETETVNWTRQTRVDDGTWGSGEAYVTDYWKCEP